MTWRLLLSVALALGTAASVLLDELEIDARPYQAERAKAFVQRHFSWESKTCVLENLLLDTTDSATPRQASR